MERRSVSMNAVALVVSRVVVGVLGITTAVIAARHLGADRFGTYASIVLAMFVANVVVTFGTDTLVIREVAAGDTDAVSEAVGVQVPIAIAVTVAGLAAAAIAGTASLAVASIAILPGVWGTASGAVLRGRERMDLVAVATSIGAVVTLVATVVAAANDASDATFVAAVVAGTVVGAVISLVLASTRSRPTDAAEATSIWSPRITKSAWRASFPFAAMVLASTIAAAAGLFSLEAFGTEEGTGHYGAANRINEGLRILPASIFGALFPAMGRGVHRSGQYRRSQIRLLWVMAAATVAVVLLAGPFFDLVLPDYDDAVPVLRVLAIGLVPLTIRLRLSFELISEGEDRIVAEISVMAAVISVMLCVFAAIAGSEVVVAAATVIGLVAHVVLLWSVRRRSELDAPGDPTWH